jgi:hypothetical protein
MRGERRPAPCNSLLLLLLLDTDNDVDGWKDGGFDDDKVEDNEVEGEANNKDDAMTGR